MPLYLFFLGEALHVLYICDLLRENRPFGKIFQNTVGDPKVMLAKKLIPTYTIFGQEMESLVLYFEQI